MAGSPIALNKPDRGAALSGASSAIYQVWGKGQSALSQGLSALSTFGNSVKVNTIDTDVDWGSVTPPVLSIDLGVFPSDPELSTIPDPMVNFIYTEVPYLSALLDAIKAKFISDLDTESSGLIQSVEDDLFAREEARDITAYSDTVDRISDRFSFFALPAGIMTASWASVVYDHNVLDKDRKLNEDKKKAGIENTNFVLEQSTSLEGSLMSDNIERNRNRIVAASATIEVEVETFLAEVKQKLAQIQIYVALAQAHESKARAIAVIAQIQTDLYNAYTEMYKGLSRAAMKSGDLQMMNMQIALDAAQDACSNIGRIASAMIAGALSAVNANVSMGYGASASLGQSGSERPGYTTSDENTYDRYERTAQVTQYTHS